MFSFAACYKCESPSPRKQHIYQGLQGRTVLEDISDDDEDEIEDEMEDEEELNRLKNCLDRAKNSISFLKERERKLKDRYFFFL